MSALALTAAELRRLFRDKTAMFFVVLLPVVVILLVGVTVGGHAEMRVAVTGSGSGPLARGVAEALDAASGLRARTDLSPSQARTSLRRGEVAGVVAIDPRFDALVRSGGTATVQVLVQRASSSAPAVMSTVNGVVSREVARLHAARFVGRLGVPFDEGLRDAGRASAVVPAISVTRETVDATSSYLPLGFSYSAPTMLVLFVFINALAGGAALIQSRRLGVLGRALAAPARPRDLVVGETAAFLTLALLQSVLIVVVGAVLFGVSWGDPLAAGALVGVWALVGTGAGVLAGTVFRTPEQASSIGPAVGIAAGMLGGCMWPLEIVPPFLRSLGHAFPHAWAVDAWVEVLSRAGGLGDILRPLGVLAGFAAVFLVLASWRLGRRLQAG